MHLVFPNQLFPLAIIKQIPKSEHIVFWEDPIFYGDRKGSAHGPASLKLNKLRLAYMFVANRAYVSWLRENGWRHVTHVTVDELWSVPLQSRYEQLSGLHSKSITYFDPVDHLWSKRTKHALKHALMDARVLDTPAFVLTTQQAREFARGSGKGKRMQHAPFYAKVRDFMNVLKGAPSQDGNNRKPYPLNAAPPPAPYVARTALAADAAAVQWLDAHPIFKNNPGPSDLRASLTKLPITHAEVRAWLDKFIKERLRLFGPYEDAIVQGEPWLEHSGLSTYLNMGLITPNEVVRAVVSQKSVPIESLEGFVRQLLGWREYCRAYYLIVKPSVYTKNTFKLKRRLGKEWYAANTGIPIVDDAIRDAFNMGYLHHIRRLMVMSNYMTLSGIAPSEVFKWMYEFSLDSWDVFMVFNVYSMGTWSDGGHAMRKPYISSSAYVKRMSRAESGPWEDVWDAKFKNFLNTHANIIKHTQLAGLLKKNAV